jgi:hypothetical protein
MINTKRNRKDLYVNLDKINLIKRLKTVLGPGGGYHARVEDGKFVPNMPTMATDAPWVYVKVSPGMRCDIYHRILFNILNMVPSRCRECWKVVVRPRTVVELFDLYEFQREMGVPCKCGTEQRETVHGLYGGYFYCRGEKEGQERYQEVRELVNAHLSVETPVILKRYCTEYEIGPNSLGPSDALPDMTDDELWLEEYVIAHFPSVGFGTPQPDHITSHVMMEWVQYAYKHGDETFKVFTDGSPLFKPYSGFSNLD